MKHYIVAILAIAFVVILPTMVLSSAVIRIAGISMTPLPTSSFAASPTPTSPSFSMTSPLPQSSGVAWVYPSGLLVEATPRSVSLKTNDDPQSVTDWYSQKMKTDGFQNISKTSNSSNDTTTNTLTGENEWQTVHISITSFADTATKIEVTTQNR